MNLITKTYKDPRPAALLILLIAIIFFVMSRFPDEPTFRVDSKGFAKDILVNYGYTLDGDIVITTPEGNVLQRIKPKKNTGTGPIHRISNISITAIGPGNRQTVTNTSKNSFIDMLFPSAHATHYYGLPHTYYLYSTIDGVGHCDVYDITNYPPSYTWLGTC